MKLMAKKISTGLLTFVVGFAPLATQAEIATQSSWLDPYFKVADVEVTAGPLEVLDVSSPFAIRNDCDPDYAPFGAADGLLEELDVIEPVLDKVDVIVDKIINIGSKIWAIVESNAPVVDINMPPANALPSGTRCWTQLENWQQPRSREYEVNYKNGFGMNIVSFKYRVIFTPGGSVDGTGQYLANVTVFPAKVYVAWGFDFNAEASIGNIMNLGTTTNPEAGMEIAVHWRVKTMLSDSQSTENFFVRGNGEMVEL